MQISDVASEVNIIPGLLNFCFRLWTGLKFVTCFLQQSGIWGIKRVTLKSTLFTSFGQKVGLWSFMGVSKCPPTFTRIKMPRKSFGMTLSFGQFSKTKGTAAETPSLNVIICTSNFSSERLLRM